MSGVHNSSNSEGGVGQFAMEQANSNDQLVGLLQAVTSVEGREAPSRLESQPQRSPLRPSAVLRRSQSVQVNQVPRNFETPGRGFQRRRLMEHNGLDNGYGYTPHSPEKTPLGRSMSARKRKRGANELQENAIPENGPARNVQEIQTAELEFREVPPQPAVLDAKAAGVHSAAALFRQPSASSQKYTRPPMSKLFSSLELSPEHFLHLQAAAKSYMLDDTHPERRACVGHRGTGDTDMVKLRLFNCVKEFLENGGHGERFFGGTATQEGASGRALVWPAQKQEIIAAVTPLLRRMVTNERQRQYALETRKSGVNGRRRRSSIMEDSAISNSFTEDHFRPPESVQFQRRDETPDRNQAHDFLEPQNATPYPAEPRGATGPHTQSAWEQSSPKRKRFSFVPGDDAQENMEPPRDAAQRDLGQVLTPPETTELNQATTLDGSLDGAVRLHLNLLRPNGIRACPRIDLLSTSCGDFGALRQHFYDHLPSHLSQQGRRPQLALQGLTERGLVPITDDESFAGAILSVKERLWMESELKIVAHLT